MGKNSPSHSQDGANVTYQRIEADEAHTIARLPAFSVHWHRSGHVFIGGGGGSKGTGVPSGIYVNKLIAGDLLEPIGFLNTRDRLVYAMAAHPTEPVLACAINEWTYYVEWDDQGVEMKVKRKFVSDQSDDDPFQSAVAFSHNGEIVATGGDDHIVRLYDYASGELLEAISEHSKGITAISFSVDGDAIASTASEDMANVWKVDKSQLWKIVLRNAETSKKMEFRGCRFSRMDSNLLYTWMADSSGSYLTLWDCGNGSLLKKVHLDRTPPVQGEMSSDGTLLAVATMLDDATVYIFETSTLRMVGRHKSLHNLPLTGMDFSPCSTRLATVSADQSYAIVPTRTSRGCSWMLLLQLLIAVGVLVILAANLNWDQSMSSPMDVIIT